MAASIPAMGSFAQANTALNMSSITTARTTIPQNLCVRTASSRSPQVLTGSTGCATTPSTTRETQPYRAIVSTAGTG